MTVTMSRAKAAAVKSRNADCPRCAASPLEACWPDTHLERVLRAARYGLVSGEELAGLLEVLNGFSIGMAFRPVPQERAA